MKKLIFSFFIFVIAGFAAQTLPVLAVTSPPAASVLGPEETKILTQALSVLKIVLEDMRDLVASAPSPIQNSAELSIGLEAINGKLTLINATIESQALAYAKREGGAKSVALSPSILTPTEFVKKSPPLPREEAIPKEETATLTASISTQNILWFALVLIVIAGAIFFWQWRKKIEPELARAVVQEPQKPIVPMVREDNIQGIPPSY